MKRLSILVSVVLIIGLSGCVTKRHVEGGGPGGLRATETPKASNIEPEARVTFFQAERTFNSRRYDEAAKLYQQVKIKHPRGRAAILSSYRLGTIYYYTENYRAAVKEFEQFLGRYPSSELNFDVTYNLAAAEYQLQHYEKAYQVLSRFKKSDIAQQGPRRAEVVYQLAAQTSIAMNNPAGAVASYAAQMQLPMEESGRALLIENIDTQLGKITNRGDLDRMLAEIQEPTTRGRITMRMSSLAAAEVQAATQPTPVEPGKEATNLPLGTSSTADRLNIGVILPLTGKWAVYGRRALDGILLASRIYSSSRESDFRMYVEDSASNPAVAQRAVDTLFNENRVVAIIGPLYFKEAAAVAERAQQLGILNLSLSGKEGISEKGAYLFQNALTPRVQMDSLLRYCVGEKRFKRFAILAPDNNFGKDMTAQFWDIAELSGARVVGFETYPQDEKDFQKPIQRLVGLAETKFRKFENARVWEFMRQQKAKTGKDSKARLPPVIDFDALFIPDGPRTVATIAKSLAYYDVTGVPLLGTTEWNSDALYQKGGKDVEGAIFPGALSAGTHNASQQQFLRLYNDAYGSAPDLLAGQAYEAMLLVAAAIRKSGSSDRNDLVNSMINIQNFDSPLGTITFDSTRIAKRRLPVYMLETGGNIVEE